MEIRASDEQTTEIILTHLGQRRNDKGDVVEMASRELVLCDSADPKAIANYREAGIDARPVAKTKLGRDGYVMTGIKWLQSLREIVIDPVRDPLAADEFPLAEYEQTRDGEYTSTLPDANNHSIDRTRYAMSAAIIRRQ
jgi:phage terminase large subunit